MLPLTARKFDQSGSIKKMHETSQQFEGSRFKNGRHSLRERNFRQDSMLKTIRVNNINSDLEKDFMRTKAFGSVDKRKT